MRYHVVEPPAMDSPDNPSTASLQQDVANPPPDLSHRRDADADESGPLPGALPMRSSTAPSALSAVRASPNSQRTRDRGYSLRRVLFARGMNSQSDPVDIELAEASISKADAPAGTKEKVASLAVKEDAKAESSRDGEQGIHPSGGGNRRTKTIEFEEGAHPARTGYTGNRSSPRKFGGRLRRPKPPGPIRQHRILLDKIIGNIDSLREKIVEALPWWKPIPPSRDGRHIELDTSRETPLIDERTGIEYIDNSIRSSRYST